MADAVKVEGLKQLTSDLKKLEAEAPKRLRLISKEAAEIVSTEAKSVVPVRTGRLRNKIKPGATQKGAYVKASLIYAAPIHWGWPRHNIAPQPFLYEALDARREEVIERFAKGVDQLVEQTVHSGLGS